MLIRVTSTVDYAAIRSGLATGDVVFFENLKGFYAWLIRLCTSIPTHVGVVEVDSAGNVLIFEALSQGITKSFLSQRIADADGRHRSGRHRVGHRSCRAVL